MLPQLSLVALLLGSAVAQQTFTAKSYTGWDCCKPICSVQSNNNQGQTALKAHGIPKVCDKYNSGLTDTMGLSSVSGCGAAAANQGANVGYLCSDYAPYPVSANLSYGFAIQVGGSRDASNPNCCKCYDIEWRGGNARGKHMIVQTVIPGTARTPVKANDMIILVPGGGVGPETSGCTGQYGTDYKWGDQYGGTTARAGCDGLPDSLQGGCYWRWNWAGGSASGWDITYKQTECPSRLTDVSGCSA